MEFLIFSDSHGHVENMQAAISRQVTRFNGIFFLGDGVRDLDHPALVHVPSWPVRGNCDLFAPSPIKTEMVFEFYGHTLLITHGHEWGVKGGFDALIAHAVEVGADVILFGHTHKPILQTFAAGEVVGEVTLPYPMHLFNPGSIGYDEDGEGPSFGTLTIKEGVLLFGHGRL